MKKLLYILLLSTLTFGFAACGSDDDDNRPPMEFDDWNDDRNPNYKPNGYNPIEGEWIGVVDENFKFVFTADFIETTEIKIRGVWQSRTNFGKYMINNKEYRRNDKQVLQYTITQSGNREILTVIGVNTNYYYRYK